jgi:hypothetical protein
LGNCALSYSLPRVRSQYKLRKKRLTGQND